MSLAVYLDCCCCDARLYSSDITHNLGEMARAARIYTACWRPEEMGATHAKHLIPALTAGLAMLKADRERFEAFNSPNGWGLYEHFVPFVERYLEACNKYPEAKVSTWR